MQQAILIFLGGGIGSLLRYFIGIKFNNDTFSYGTFLVNIIGSLLIGFVMSYHLKTTNQNLSQSQLAFLVIGIFGGFTTFSSFMYENLQLLQQAQYFKFMGYTLLSLVVGFTAVYVGFLIGKIL